MPGLSASPLPSGVIVLERGWLSSNNVVIVGPSEVAVVDTGYWTHAEQTLALVSRAADGCPITKVVNTHLHSDHCGGNAAIQAAHPAVQLLIPPGQAEAVRRWDPVELTYEGTGQHCPRFHPDGVVQPGDRTILGEQGWIVHAAPGHDPHSVVLFEPQSRTLISADALWENGFGVVFPELEGEHAFDEVQATLDMIEGLAPATVIPGHGPVFSDVRGALSRARARLAVYRAKPDRHAAHAAKVLVKFRLLETQRLSYQEFLSWTGATSYFQTVRERWFGDVPHAEWISVLVAELMHVGAIGRDGDDLVNR